MWTEWVTFILIIGWALGGMIFLGKTIKDEEEYRRKYGNWK